jgi:hypothetical protein
MEGKQLAIELSPSSVRLTSLNSGQVSAIHSFDFSEKQDFRYKEQLDQIFEESGLKNSPHDEYTVSWTSEKTTLVPGNVFGETDAESVFRLCFGNQTASQDIDYNRIPEAGLINVFEVPYWVKSYFVLRHPRSIIQHESTMVLRNLMQNPAYRLKILLIPYEKHFLLTLVKDGKLQFYSVFDYQQAEDILYHFMFTLQQKELLQEGDLIWVNGLGANSALKEAFIEQYQRVSELKKIQLSFNQEFILNSHKLCV